MSQVDNLIFLKDATTFWRTPSVSKVQNGLGRVSFDIYYPMMFGQEPPMKPKPFITRGTIKRTETEVSYFVAVWAPPRQVITGFSYPPVGTNQLDAIGMYNSCLKGVRYIDQDDYDKPFTEYVPPQEVKDLLSTVLY